MEKSNLLIQVFHTDKGAYLYDTNTNAVVSISDEVYRYLDKNGDSFDRDEEDMPEEIYRLMDHGYLSNKHAKIIRHPSTDYLEDILASKVAALTLQVTRQCNFRCDYCIYSGKYDTRTHSNEVMTWETAKAALDFLLEHSSDAKSLHIGFYGGEPFLAFDLMKASMDYIDENVFGKKVIYNITTNGTILTEEYITYLEEHDVELMISLDGPEEIHDNNRKFLNRSESTFKIVMKNLARIQERHPDYYKKISFSTVVDPLLDVSLLDEFFSENELVKDHFVNANFMTTENLLDGDGSITLRYPEIYQLELKHMFLSKLGQYDEEKVSKLAESHFRQLQTTASLLQTHQKELPDSIHHGGVCVPGTRRLFVTVKGDLFPCEKCSELYDVMKAGDIYHGFDFETIKKLINIGTLTEDACKNCWAIRLCQICAVGLEGKDGLSAEKKKQKCKNVKAALKEQLIEYCKLKEQGYSFEKNTEVKFR